MKRTLITIMVLCCFTVVAEAQKTKVVLETLQRETEALQRKVDSLERLCWMNEAQITTLESRVEKLTDKLYGQVDAYNKMIVELNKKIEDVAANPQAVAEAPFEFLPDEQFIADRLKVRHRGLYGFIDRSENLVIPCIFDDAETFWQNGVAVVKKSGKFGVIDITGKTILPFEYDDWGSGDREDRSIRLNKNNKWGVAQLPSGNLIIPCQYDNCRNGAWRQGAPHFLVQKNSKWGVIDIDGRIIINFIDARNAIWHESKYRFDTNQGQVYYDIYGKKTTR
ncbi:MAG: WG repeat-containing protein [Bacteroidales bacterium]|nr:WG repeat-containing protein [Bacteroidales bacterium]